jgi:DNA-binding Lrp family transcriptional regulator
MELDETEIKILRELQKDASISKRRLAKKVDVSTPTISSKIEKLEDMGIIQGYKLHLDYDKLGLTKYVLIVDTVPDKLEKVSNEISDMDLTYSIEELDGISLKVEVFSRDVKHFDSYLEDVRQKDGINKIDVRRVSDFIDEKQEIPIFENAEINIKCYYCNKSIKGDPVKLKMDGRDHYLCCSSCADLYEKKYQKLKEGID